MCVHTSVDVYSSLGINVTKNYKHIAHCKNIATLKSPTAFGFCSYLTWIKGWSATNC